jgi:hypothetical protein
VVFSMKMWCKDAYSRQLCMSVVCKSPVTTLSRFCNFEVMSDRICI